jgi:hypothetical protein
VRHFHVVFTLPSELRRLARARPKEIFDTLFHAASRTLIELGASRLGALPGVTMVLHTWTRDLRFHPHVHAIVTAGGLALDGQRWVDSHKDYLFPVKVMGLLLRGKMMDALRALHGKDAFDGLYSVTDFEQLLAGIAQQSWVVYAKKPFRRAGHVLDYLGRYTHRVGIANSRLLDVGGDYVTFRTKNGCRATLTPLEFLRRFVQHVLPAHFVKIRHCGLLAASNVDGRLEIARRLLALRNITIPPAPRSLAPPAKPDTCPVCSGPLTRTQLPRGPPLTRNLAAA